jgi:cytochrome P450
MMNPSNIMELEFYSFCFNESLRMQPPVYTSSLIQMTKDVTAGGLKIRKGDAVSIDMWRLANNPKEFIEPQSFIPERFDS